MTELPGEIASAMSDIAGAEERFNPLVKVRVDTDEYYPFHDLVLGRSGIEVEVPKATAAWWRKVMTEFELVQDDMAAYRKAAIEKRAR